MLEGWVAHAWQCKHSQFFNRTLYAGLSETQCAPTEPSTMQRETRFQRDSIGHESWRDVSIQFNPDSTPASFPCDAPTTAAGVAVQ